MKILIVSDTHRKHENLNVVLERTQPVDMVIHLGDAEGEEDYIRELAGCPLEIVAGNNDFFSCLPREKELEIGKYRVLITHRSLLLCECRDCGYREGSVGAQFRYRDVWAYTPSDH